MINVQMISFIPYLWIRRMAIDPDKDYIICNKLFLGKNCLIINSFMNGWKIRATEIHFLSFFMVDKVNLFLAVVKEEKRVE